MKRVFVTATLAILAISRSFAQQHDDKLVTGRLAINTDQEKYTLFAAEFRSGFDKVKSGVFTSVDDITTATGIDLRKYSRLDQLQEQLRNESSRSAITPEFVAKLSAAIKNNTNPDNSISDYRNALVAIADGAGLTAQEKEVLAYIDIATQEMVKTTMPENDLAKAGTALAGDFTALSGMLSVSDQNSGAFQLNAYDDYKLPAWAKCVLGTIGSAIAGGWAGGSSGMAMGTVVPGVGTALGGVIGGISGVVSGVFVGVATFC